MKNVLSNEPVRSEVFMSSIFHFWCQIIETLSELMLINLNQIISDIRTFLCSYTAFIFSSEHANVADKK